MIESLIFFALIAWCSIFARMAGGGVWTRRPPQFAEILMTLTLGGAVVIENDHAWLTGFVAFLWSYAWFQTAHAVAFHMNNGIEHDAENGRKGQLSEIIDPLCWLFRKPLGGDFYCWTFMGLKGALMMLPLGLWALPASLLWPAAYFFGNRICYKRFPSIDGEMIAEFVSGGVYGALVAAYVFLPLL